MFDFHVTPTPTVAGLLDQWRRDQLVERIWAKDMSVWSERPVAELSDRLGWLDLPFTFAARLAALRRQLPALGGRVHLLGMGGSSLAPEVFAAVAGSNRLRVADSTHPAAVKAALADFGPDDMVVVASKSGTTVETKALLAAYWQVAQNRWQDAAAHFCAISDPGTPLAAFANTHGIHYVASPTDVGGRFSALSAFGLVPAVLAGLSPEAWTTALGDAVERCRQGGPDNPAVQLGAIMVAAHANGRDKLTLALDPPLGRMFDWLEQLIAESLGKAGRGLTPLRADLQSPAVAARADVQRLTLAGQADDLAAMMFVWELAVAIAGAAMGLQPFDQPNVESAKRRMRERLGGTGPKTDDAIPLTTVSDATTWLSGQTRALWLLAFTRPAEAEPQLPALAKRISARFGLPVAVGVGPRFLHASGQLHKGSPQKAAYLQIIDTIKGDTSVPHEPVSFGQLLAAQADGDFLALRDVGADVRRVKIGKWEELSGLIG